MSRTALLRALTVATLTATLASCGLLHQGATEGRGSGSARNKDSVSSQGAPYDATWLLNPKVGKFLGLEAPGAPDSLVPAYRFAASIGRRPNLIGQYVAWNSSFDTRGVRRAWSYGAMSYLAWEPTRIRVRAIAEGHADRYITRFATAIRILNLPIALSFGHEMNGFWYPWGTTQTTAADFVAAWRHIHDLFIAAGASNVIWVWNPNVINPMPTVRLKPYYPGDAYVDWIGITGYFATTGPHAFKTLYAPTMRQIMHFTSKRFIIAETSVETGPVEVACAHQLIGTVTRHSNVLGLIWFDYDKDGVDWRIETRPILRGALARGLAEVKLVHMH